MFRKFCFNFVSILFRFCINLSLYWICVNLFISRFSFFGSIFFVLYFSPAHLNENFFLHSIRFFIFFILADVKLYIVLRVYLFPLVFYVCMCGVSNLIPNNFIIRHRMSFHISVTNKRSMNNIHHHHHHRHCSCRYLSLLNIFLWFSYHIFQNNNSNNNEKRYRKNIPLR